MATGEQFPHPILKEPVLYVLDPPKRIKWMHILEAFNSCGTVTSSGKSCVDNNPNRKKWTLLFPTLFQAEMALATLQGHIITRVNPVWEMVLSHSPTLESALPLSPLFPQFVKSNGSPLSMGNDTTPQTLFKWFRQAGPLVSVRTNVNVGYAQRAVVVQYWDEEHANKARVQNNALHADMGKYPSFTLRTFDPCNLYCAGFGPMFTHQNFIDAFSQFGSINQTVLKRAGVPGGFGFISFINPDSTATALHAMNGTVIDGCTITVRYHEPGAQGIFRNRYSSNSAPPPAQPGGAPASEQPASPNGTRATSEPDEAQQAREQQQRQEAAAQELREAAERRAKEAAAMKAAAEKVKRQQDRRARREAAERAEQQAKKNLDAARADEDNAEIEVLLVSEAKATADAMLADAKLASLEAKRAWLLAMDKEAKAERVANDALEDIEHALHKRQQAEACRKIAEQEEISFRKAREDIDNEAEEDEIKVDEETLRLAELAEKIKRMEELKKLEKEEKEARQRREQEAKKAEEERLEQERKKREKEEAERLARLREEAERLARERQEREAQEKRQAENTKRLYFQAAMAERARCNKRDLRYCATWDMTMWNVQRALDRFVGVSEEFDSLKFHETAQPLTFESIPWPILDHPHRMSLDLIEGIAVNKFFATMKSMQTHGEYMSMIKKARNRFHPDRWRSRGILNSVLDENLRGRLETAGNEVSKQINHLWDKGL